MMSRGMHACIATAYLESFSRTYRPVHGGTPKDAGQVARTSRRGGGARRRTDRANDVATELAALRLDRLQECGDVLAKHPTDGDSAAIA